MILICSCVFNYVSASDYFGGEITWRCVSANQYIFKINFYRDCNGVTTQQSMNMTTNIPGLPTFPMTLVSQTDISPGGFIADGVGTCEPCSSGGMSTIFPGIIELLTFESAVITLPGIPPATGWTFTWGYCCNSLAINNLALPGFYGYQLRAVMFPHPGSGAGLCTDNSPYFIARPSIVNRTGQSVNYNAMALDDDRDSITYEWTQPYDDLGNPIPFAPPYTVNSQLPSTIQNPNNIPAVLDPLSGKISFTSFTGGYFLTGIKVSAYKCGTKVSETYRDLGFIVNNNCPPLLNAVPNQVPVFTPPFINSTTGLQTSYVDTVYAGDTVNFTIAVTDLDQFTNGNGQQVSITAWGSQLSTLFIDPSAGCGLPSCATTNVVPPVTAPIGSSIMVNWVTGCDHLGGCNNETETYYFGFTAHDNYCTANGTSTAVVAITVVPRRTEITASNPNLCPGDSVMLVATGADSYTWNNGLTNDTIYISQSGTYIVTGIFAPGICTLLASDTVVYTMSTFSVNASVSTDTVCVTGPTLSLTGTPSGGAWTGPGMTGSAFIPANAGLGVHTIYYSASNAIGCTGIDSLTITVTVCTGLSEPDNETDVYLSPNPTSDGCRLFINGKQHEKISISLYDAYGKKVKELFCGTTSMQNWELNVDTRELSKGFYLIGIEGTLNVRLRLVIN